MAAMLPMVAHETPFCYASGLVQRKQSMRWIRETLTVRILLVVLLLAAPGTSISAGEIVATSDAVFLHPHNLIFSPDGERIFVADMGHDMIRTLDPIALNVTGSHGAGFLSGPHDLAFDRNGDLLVADTNNNRIVRFRVDRLVVEFAGVLADEVGYPEGIVADRQGRVYVAGTGQGRISVLDAGRTIAAVVDAAGRKFVQPHGIRQDRSGRLWLTDAGNNRLLVLDKRLKSLRVIDGARLGLIAPKYLHIDAKGRLFVTDERTGSVHVLDADLKPVATLGAGQLRQPEGVLSRGDDVWVADTYNNRIVRFLLRPSSKDHGIQ